MRRQDRQTGAEEALEILSSAPYAVVSAIDPKGRPYSTPVTPVLMNGAVYFHSAVEGGARSRALDANPEVSLCFVARCDVLASRYTIDYASALVRGRCTRLSDPGECKAALAAVAQRYAPQNDPAMTEQYIEAAWEKVTVWKVSIEELSGKSRNPRKAA